MKKLNLILFIILFAFLMANLEAADANKYKTWILIDQDSTSADHIKLEDAAGRDTTLIYGTTAGIMDVRTVDLTDLSIHYIIYGCPSADSSTAKLLLQTTLSYDADSLANPHVWTRADSLTITAGDTTNLREWKPTGLSRATHMRMIAEGVTATDSVVRIKVKILAPVLDY